MRSGKTVTIEDVHAHRQAETAIFKAQVPELTCTMDIKLNQQT
jgi:hypothetical protein